VTLGWDDGAEGWRITILPTGSPLDYEVGGPLDAADVEGFHAIRPAGVVEGSPIVEEVRGDASARGAVAASGRETTAS
jgi:hypothetical protein